MERQISSLDARNHQGDTLALLGRQKCLYRVLLAPSSALYQENLSLYHKCRNEQVLIPYNPKKELLPLMRNKMDFLYNKVASLPHYRARKISSHHHKWQRQTSR